MMMARWHFTQASLRTTISRYATISWAQQQCNLSTEIPSDHSNRGRPRCLPPMKDFFLTLVRLRLGLLEHIGSVSLSLVSRIFTTWINFLYHQFKQIPLWPPREFVQAHMPKLFKEKYPTTQIIIDTTEMFIQQPSLPAHLFKLQHLQRAHYHHQALLPLSPGSISDKELTRQSGLA